MIWLKNKHATGRSNPALFEVIMKIYIVNAYYADSGDFAYIVGAYDDLSEAITQAMAQENLSREGCLKDFKKCKIFEVDKNSSARFFNPIWG